MGKEFQSNMGTYLSFVCLNCWIHFKDSISALKRPHVEVLNWGSAYRIDFDTGLKLIFSHTHTAGVISIQSIQHLVCDQFEAAGAGKFGKHILGSVLGDIHKGVQTTERMLIKGTTLTGIGELVSGPDGVTLQPPNDGRPYYLVKNSLSSLIKEVEGSRYTLRICLKIFIGIGVILSGAALWKLYKKMKAKEDAEEQLDTIRAERSNRSAGEAEDNVPINVQCVVCLGAEREVCEYSISRGKQT